MNRILLYSRWRSLILGAKWIGLALCFLASHYAGAQSLAGDRSQIHGPLSVVQAVQIGRRENLMVQAARADVGVAAAETRMARSMTYPQVSANGHLTYGDAANIFSSAPNVTPVNTNLIPARGFANLNLTLMFPLYTGGRLASLVKSASERQRAAVADVVGVEAETSLMIKDAYYRTLLGSEFVKVAQARVDADTELVHTAQAQFDAGKGIEATALRAEAELADAQKELTTTQNMQAKALLDLKTAMGVRLDSDLALADTLQFSPPAGDVDASLLEAARTRPELASARARLRAAQAQTGAAKGSLLPQVYAGLMGNGFSSRAMGDGTGYSAGITISYPLFDAGQRHAEVSQARAQQKRADAESRNMELRVANEVRQAWLDVETAAQNYRTAQSALQAAQSAYDVIALRVQNQKSILVEQLDALTALTRARANVAQALYDHALAVAQLQRAVGKW